MKTLLFVFVLVVIAIQLILTRKTLKLISNSKKILSGEFSLRVIANENICQVCHECPNEDNVSKCISSSINTYLEKNKGAVSDFSLVKDIVERNSDSIESEITSQTPLPLYLGLMGTVSGIILGLFAITSGGGFSRIDSLIEDLMDDVAVSMIASFVGIGLTTLSLWKSKKCKAIVEQNKNRFYTWVQTNLLPMMSQSAVSEISLLQRNLTRFNNTFLKTVDRLEYSLGGVGDLYESQIEVLQKIESIDVNKMASANVKVLAGLNNTIPNLEKFSQYMQDVTEYLVAVRELNKKLDDHLERTEALGIVSDFYKKQMKEIEYRQSAIKSAVLSVDDTTKSALETLKSNSGQGLKSMQEAFVTQMTTMQEVINKQNEKLLNQMHVMPQLITKMEEISAIPSRLDKLIDRIEKSNNTLSKNVTKSLTISSQTRGGGKIPIEVDTKQSKYSFNPWMRWTIFIAIMLMALACILNLSVNIMTNYSVFTNDSTILADSTIQSPTNPKQLK